MYKKSVAFILALLLCLSFTGCTTSNDQDEKNEISNISSIESDFSQSKISDNTFSSDSYIENKPSQSPSIESEEETVIHTAIQGAIITSQDGSEVYSYKKKCEACGNIDSSSVRTGSTAGSTTRTTFFCKECGNTQDVEIKHTSD